MLGWLTVQTLFFGFGCQKPVPPPTDFLRTFNLGQVVEHMEIPEFRAVSGGGSASTAIAETTCYRRDSSIIYRIEEQSGKEFDKDHFLAKLKAEIAERIKQVGMRSDELESTSDSFGFNYSTATNDGWIGIIGVRLEGDEYKLWCMIREHAGP